MRALLGPLRHRPYRFLLAGRLVTVAGNSVAPIALAFAVLDLTGSATDLGLVVGARSLANVVFLLAGGLLADRLPRQLILVGSGALAAVTQGAIAALVLGGQATIPLLVALSAVNGAVSAFAMPASSALLPQTVPAAELKQANALGRLGVTSVTIGGAAAGGVLVAAFGAGWGLAVDAAAFALGLVLFALLRVPSVRAARSAGARHDLRVGWREFAGRTWLWVVVATFGVLNAAWAGAVNVLGPTLADDTFGRGNWGLILAANAAGMAAGAVVALRVRVRRLLRYGCVAMLAWVPFVAALAVAPSVLVLVPVSFVAGVAVEQFGVAWETSVQDNIPADRLARVYSYDMLGSFVAIPLGQVAAGPLAGLLGRREALLVAAGVMLLAVLAMLASRSVRTLRYEPTP
ncbi:MFS transporter [Pilimelia anulata]|uniref:MFS transporter n=1 Tax=Pilimelia anulata TaxID=53371 RepID=A0A8J3B9I9_9ACTN|nr:MFS transporter [Pilimelia anulata]GGJ87161.1 MFS transporter [Pilimelia anulata]